MACCFRSRRGILYASDVDATFASCVAPQFDMCNGRLQDLKKYYILGEVLALVDLSLVRLQPPAALRGWLWSAWPCSSCRRLTVAGAVSRSRGQSRPAPSASLSV